MAKRQFHLTDAQEQELIQAYTRCSDGATRTRYQAVRMYGTNYPLTEILKLTRCSTTSLMEWCQAFTQAGASALVDGRLGGNSAKLTSEQRIEIEMRLHQYTPRDLFGLTTATPDGQFWTVEDLQRALKDWYGIEYASRTSYRTVLHACGFSYQHPAKVFKSQRPAQMWEFEEQVEKN
jgi:transposase